MGDITITLPVAAVTALWEFYLQWTERIGTYEPTEEQIRSGMASLLTIEDSHAMDTAGEAVEPFAPLIRGLLASPTATTGAGAEPCTAVGCPHNPATEGRQPFRAHSCPGLGGASFYSHDPLRSGDGPDPDGVLARTR